ncbi:unnamed protein product [Darwinula stevensoni]|uniref:Uncharacterized protein n=1 Tax=Darwinula stevensoni TaxID=69355 RepID=A0A7R9A7L5_9CRUS|nr:unnamed protein product [Darwinula stevensoni]CAG0892427.1 unnamed protein product [Darwinula stevensoni]
MGIVDDPRTVIMTLDAQFSDQATEVDSALSGDHQSNVQPRTRTSNASFDEDGKKNLRVSSFRSTKSDEGTDTDEFEQLNGSNGDHSSTGSLHEELQRAKHEVLIREEELNNLRSIRNKMEDEVRDLTASLFEEANKKVCAALQKSAGSEKALKEANMKVEGLQAEVQALKALVLTSTPSNPNLSCQAHSPCVIEQQAKGFLKRHKRSPSHPIQTISCAHLNGIDPNSSQSNHGEVLEVDPKLEEEFLLWRESPVVEWESPHPFFRRILQEDILPCLTFSNEELSLKIQEAMKSHSISIESVSAASRQFPKNCALLKCPRICTHIMQLGDGDEEGIPISQLCRNRITGVCDLLVYLRYIERGLVKANEKEVYEEIMRLRLEVAAAKLGFHNHRNK